MPNHPFIVGLSGNIATGKSTVLAYLAGKGAHVIDADKLAHRTLTRDGAAYEKAVTAFGPAILDADGSINRLKLGKIVFGDHTALERLEEIVHPATFELVRWDITQAEAQVIVIEAIKLIESGRIASLCDEIWVVTSLPETQLRRLMENRGMSEAEARQRMTAQTAQAEKVARADRVIHNDGTPEELYQQLDRLWAELMQRLPSIVP